MCSAFYCLLRRKSCIRTRLYFSAGLPNKIALRRLDDGKLLGLMSYELNEKGLALVRGGPQLMTHFG